jgi:hypothetical protein
MPAVFAKFAAVIVASIALLFATACRPIRRAELKWAGEIRPSPHTAAAARWPTRQGDVGCPAQIFSGLTGPAGVQPCGFAANPKRASGQRDR